MRALLHNDHRAEAAGLNYGSDRVKDIRRQRAGTGFRYLGPSGRPVRDPAPLRRITSLAIPPAWTEVWISPDPKATERTWRAQLAESARIARAA